MASLEEARRQIKVAREKYDDSRKQLKRLDVKKVILETKAVERELEGELCIDTKQYDEKVHDEDWFGFSVIPTYCEKRLDELEEKHDTSTL